jgi:hypothetical protein
MGAAQRVTRDVEPSAVRDLFQDPMRASVAFVERGGVELLPVRSRGGTDAHEFAVRAGDAPTLDGREVVLIRDDGAYWFELRGISVRGIARRVDAREPPDAGGLLWYALEARRVLAWDYATIRNA